MSRPLRSIAEWARDKQIEETDPLKRLRSTGLPEDYWHLDWDCYEDSAGTHDESYRDILMDYDEHWEPAERKGLVVLGPAGYGKTRGLATLAASLSSRAWVKWTTEHELDERRKALIGLDKAGEASGDWEAYNRAAMMLAFIEVECDVLFLEDVGKAFRSSSGYSDVQLDGLLRKRRDRGKVTCIDSNVKHSEWAKFHPSMSSFLYEVGEIVNITRGRDHRAAAPENKARRRARR